MRAIAVVAAMTTVLVAPRASSGSTRSRSCSPGREVQASGALTAPVREFGAARARGTTIRALTPDVVLTIDLDPLAWKVTSRDTSTVLVREAPGGIFVKHALDETAPSVPVTGARPDLIGKCAIRLRVRFADGTSARLEFRTHASDIVSVTLLPDDDRPNSQPPGGVVAWGETLVTPARERIYGLTERITADVDDSERFPKEVGSLDRKGELVEMYIRPTESAYAPFYQSSRGYGLVVDGTMPGAFDVGATRSNRLRVEFEIDPTARAARWFVLGGRNHYDLNDAYSRLTGRPALPPEIVFTHWVGHDEYPTGSVGTFDGIEMNVLVADDLRHYERYDLPAGVYHFDRPWATGTEGFGTLRFDPARFPDAGAMLEAMRDLGWRPQVWFSEWLLDDRGDRARHEGWLAPGSTRELDVTDPAAVRFVQEDLRDFLDGPEGRFVDGLFLDRTDEIVPSDASDVYHDGRNGRQMHNAYPPELQRALSEVITDERGSDGWIVARAAYTTTPASAMTWGGDTPSREGISIPEIPDQGPSTDLGLRSVLVMMQRAAFMGIPYWGSDIGGYSSFADREVFARWIEVGAASPLMRFHGKGSRSPWDMPTEPRDDPEMLRIYRRYILLHHALAPYLHDLAEEAHATGAPIVRPLAYNFPDDPRAENVIDEWQIGDDMLVAPVWRSGARERTVYLPAGTWVDFWDRDRVLHGATTFVEDVPLDRLPIYVRKGSPLLEIDPPR